MNTSPCKGCGKPIVWGETDDGKKIPLDPKPPVYTVVWTARKITCSRSPREVFMVSHFATCPEANRFSGSKKKED